MTWFRRRLSTDVPPLSLPGDLSSGEEARHKAERALDDVMEQRTMAETVLRGLRELRQENHFRDLLIQAHRGRG